MKQLLDVERLPLEGETPAAVRAALFEYDFSIGEVWGRSREVGRPADGVGEYSEGTWWRRREAGEYLEVIPRAKLEALIQLLRMHAVVLEQEWSPGDR